jgi:hypothetical protein
MAAITTTRRAKASDVEQLLGELAEARAEIAELRAQLRAVAGLALGIGIQRAPVSASGSCRGVADVCRMYGISGHTETIEKIFNPGG